MKPRFVSALAAGLVLLSLLSGCKTTSEDPPVTPDPTTTVTQSVTQETTPTTEAPAPTEPAVDTASYNRLTGLYDNAAGANARAVGVMVGNNTRSRPQIGLAAADMFVEIETEGGITRIMAIFSDAARIPSQLCPIRSARSPFALMAQSLDLIYVHAGGSQAGLRTVDNLRIDHINALNSHGSTFWRDSAMLSARGTEYSLSTSGSNLKSRIGQLGLRQTSDRAPFIFGETVSGRDCTGLQITFSGSQTNSFLYDAESGHYKKSVGRLNKPQPHVTTDGTQIEVSNILVMYDTKYAENSETINFNLSSGGGILCSGGKVRDITWSRNAYGLTVSENGQPATFLPGKTYICVVVSANRSSTVIQ